ncbi:MAG: mobile mystery protein A [Vampirovibrionales bacterium]|nr:mobile mystery protein A [Vampirovibrionales bacterium]
MKSDADLARHHLDQRFQAMKALEQFSRPQKGWVRAIREALGLTLEQLGQRMSVTKQRITQLERQEIRGSFSLNTLERAAQAMGCRLVYALVPENSLQTMIEQQANRKADEILKQTGHTMGLEDQSPRPQEVEALRQKLIQELLDGKLARLWDEPS